MSYLSTVNLKIGYKSSLGESINLELDPGEILQIKGPNGSGKSTLLKTLLNEVPRLHGSVDWKISLKEVSYLPQVSTNSSNINFTLEEILDVYLVPDRIKAYLRDELRERLWVNASGGEKQLALILSRITAETKVLVLDEPFNHLDKKSRKLVEDLINKMMLDNKELSLIVVSHLDMQLNCREYELC